MSAAAAAFVPTFISFDDDDDFGEFEFAAAPDSASPPIHARSNQLQWQKTAGDEDDDWGDFVDGPLQTQPFGSPAPAPPSASFFDPFPGPLGTAPDPATVHPVPPVSADKGWKKPSGALPLSLFGEEDEEDGGGEEVSNSLDPQISALKVGTFTSFKTAGSNGVASAQGGGLRDLIASLYGQTDNVGPASAGSNDGSGDNLKVHSSDGARSDFPNGADDEVDEFNENSWEFKDALDTPLEDAGDCVLVEKEDEFAGVPGAEVKVNDRGSGFQKCNDMLGPNLPTKVLSDEGEWGNAFVSHDTTISGFEAGSADNGCNGSSTNAHHDFENIIIENGLSLSMVSGDTSLGDSFWEFKDASSNTETMKHFAEPESIVHAGINELENLHTATCSNGNQNFGDSFPVTEGRQYEPNSIVNGSENVEPRSAVGLLNLVLNISNEPRNVSTYEQSTLRWQDLAVSNETLKEPERIVDFYSRLKQKSYTLALHHIENIKRANEEEVSGEEPKAGYLDSEIKAALSKLGIVATKSDYLEKSPNDLTVYELLEVLQTPCFQPFDMEYSLSAKIQLLVRKSCSMVL